MVIVILSDRSGAKGVEGPAFAFAFAFASALALAFAFAAAYRAAMLRPVTYNDHTSRITLSQWKSVAIARTWWPAAVARSTSE
jgi:hypothetical protein